MRYLTSTVVDAARAQVVAEIFKVCAFRTVLARSIRARHKRLTVFIGVHGQPGSIIDGAVAFVVTEIGEIMARTVVHARIVGARHESLTVFSSAAR